MRRNGTLRLLGWIGGGLTLLGAAYLLASQISPWPGALLIRWAFDADAHRVSRALAEHVPSGVAAQLNQHYGAPQDADTTLDVFYPAALERGGGVLPTIVWLHGGAWISGSKLQIANYAKILAGHGYTVVGLNYSLAPAQHYPTPVRQANQALAYLTANAARLHVDAAHLLLAGDSGGAHIAAQTANVITSPAYARLLHIAPAITPGQLQGMILYCGPYDTRLIERAPRDFFLRTVLWAYSGHRDFATDPTFATAAVIDYLSGAFPPSFISVGNGD